MEQGGWGRDARRPSKEGRDDAYKAPSAGFVCCHFFCSGGRCDVGCALKERRILLSGIPACFLVEIQGESGAEAEANRSGGLQRIMTRGTLP